jgi:hypothetical protein
MIENLPTSKARSVAMGLAELEGRAKALKEPMSSPVRGLPCVWYKVRVTKVVQTGKGKRVEVFLTQEVRVPFILEDETGRVIVRPDGADIVGIDICDMWLAGRIEPPADVRKFCNLTGVPWRGSAGNASFRIQEWALLVDTYIYVMGEAGRAADPARDRRALVTARLREWLKSPEKRAALDADGNGVLEPEEWDAARDKVQTEVLIQDTASVDSAAPEIVISSPRSGYFIIAAGGEQRALKAQGYPTVLLTAGLVFFGAGVWLMPWGRLGGLVAWGLLMVMGAVMTFRSMRRRSGP